MTRLAAPHDRLKALGFTLIEVLVALGILALALGAGTRAQGALTQNAQRQVDGLLAELCAQNALVGIRLSGQMPAVGDSQQRCRQGQRVLDVTLAARATPNPNFLRVQAQVRDQDDTLLSLTTVVGRY